MNDDCLRYAFGELVMLKVSQDSPEASCGMITGFQFRPTGNMYIVGWESAVETFHYEIELIPYKKVIA